MVSTKYRVLDNHYFPYIKDLLNELDILLFLFGLYSTTKGLLGLSDIFIDLSRHVETVVSLSHKNADSHIHVNIEFGEGKGKIPVDKIAQKAEDYKPSEG